MLFQVSSSLREFQNCRSHVFKSFEPRVVDSCTSLPCFRFLESQSNIPSTTLHGKANDRRMRLATNVLKRRLMYLMHLLCISQRLPSSGMLISAMAKLSCLLKCIPYVPCTTFHSEDSSVATRGLLNRRLRLHIGMQSIALIKLYLGLIGIDLFLTCSFLSKAHLARTDDLRAEAKNCWTSCQVSYQS